MKNIKKYFIRPAFSPISLFYTTSLVSFLYVFMEWTYNLNRSTLASAGHFAGKVFIFFNSSAVLALFCGFVVLAYLGLWSLLKGEKTRHLLCFVFALVPSLLLTIMLLLLVDNTTYTLWKVGIITSKGFVRGLYGFLIVVVMLIIHPWVVNFTNRIEKSLDRSKALTRSRLLAGTLSFFLVITFLPVLFNLKTLLARQNEPANSTLENRPNIVLITVDSLNAKSMSLYGYPKETTPFLEELASSSLVGEDHFSNAQGTIGSLTSILTGRDPADTRVLASDDILEGEDAYLHLPGILKQYGYETIQLSYSYYADAGNVNIQNGFDLANSESSRMNIISSVLSSALPTNYYYFLRELFLRATDRVGHIFFLKDMSNPYKQVTESPEKFNDAYKLETALSMLETSDQPVFIDIHWMGTHGPKYYPSEQVFSTGEDPQQQKDREETFYLDSILEFDTSMSGFFSDLEQGGLLENTMVIITADHSQRWSITRLPLIIYFPGGSKTGAIETSTENLDLAPTILDYLDISQPSWMPGQSLLTMPDPDRPIFIAQIFGSDKDPVTGKITYPPSVAPFYQFGKISVVQCDTWYMLNMQTHVLSHSKVMPYSDRCGTTSLSSEQALILLKEHLAAYGFDISSLDDVTISE
jgi:phosphoglycerol transferase MdoB-like AlkP superfamily enzyme